jgi:hypothetical protein
MFLVLIVFLSLFRSSVLQQEALQKAIGEARRNAPSIVYWPHADLWYAHLVQQLHTLIAEPDLHSTRI